MAQSVTGVKREIAGTVLAVNVLFLCGCVLRWREPVGVEMHFREGVPGRFEGDHRETEIDPGNFEGERLLGWLRSVRPRSARICLLPHCESLSLQSEPGPSDAA